MTWLIAGLVVFFGAHLVPMVPAVSAAVTARLPGSGRQGLVSLLSFVGLGLVIYGYSRAGYQPVFTPPPWGRTAAAWLMLPVFGLLIAAYAPSNLKRVTRHPMLWATVVWAVAHLVANGDLASLLLFGSFCVWALAAMVSANRRGAQLQTAAVPVYWDGVALLGGLAVYFVVTHAHGSVFGVSASRLY